IFTAVGAPDIYPLSLHDALPISERLENFGTRLVGDSSEKSVDEANVPDLQRGLADREPASLERLREQRQDLGIGQRTVAADELDAGLEDLARPAGPGGLLAEHRSHVRKPEYAGQIAVAARHEPRDACREVWTERGEGAVAIEELDGPPLRRIDRAVLEQGWVQRREAGVGEDVRQSLL